MGNFESPLGRRGEGLPGDSLTIVSGQFGFKAVFDWAFCRLRNDYINDKLGAHRRRRSS